MRSPLPKEIGEEVKVKIISNPLSSLPSPMHSALTPSLPALVAVGECLGKLQSLSQSMLLE